MEFDVALSVLLVLGGVYVLLAIATAWVAILRWRAPQHDRTELVQRMRSWWIIVILFTAAMV